MRLLPVLCWVLMVAAVALAGAGGASAHATLIGSMPPEGAVVGRSPPMAALHFSEPVRPVVTRLTAPDGKSTDIQPRANGEHVELTLPELGPGTHILSWRIVSADGHPVGGALTFSVGAAGAAAQSSAPGAPGLQPLIWLARALLYAGLLFGTGTVMAGAWLAPGRVPARSASAMLVAGAVGAVLGLGLSGLDLVGLAWHDLLTPKPWREAAATTLGPSTAALLVGFGLSALSLAAAGSRPGRLLALGAALLAAGGLATTGHAANAAPEWVSRPAVAVHALGAIAWAGALPLLAALARQEAGEFMTALRRFSSAALLIVALMALAGGILGVLQVRDPAALVDTDYGRVLLAKLATVSLLLGLAAWNRFRLTRPALEGSSAAMLSLRRVAIAEIVLVLGIAGLVALWRFTPPPRALAAQEAVRGHVHLHGADAMVDIAFKPGHVGENIAEIVVMGPDFGELAPKELTLSISKPDAGIEAIERRAERLPDGRWRASGLSMPLKGPWTLRVDVLLTDFDKAILEGEFVPGQ